MGKHFFNKKTEYWRNNFSKHKRKDQNKKSNKSLRGRPSKISCFKNKKSSLSDYINITSLLQTLSQFSLIPINILKHFNSIPLEKREDFFSKMMKEEKHEIRNEQTFYQKLFHDSYRQKLYEFLTAVIQETNRALNLKKVVVEIFTIIMELYVNSSTESKKGSEQTDVMWEILMQNELKRGELEGLFFQKESTFEDFVESLDAWKRFFENLYFEEVNNEEIFFNPRQS